MMNEPAQSCCRMIQIGIFDSLNIFAFPYDKINCHLHVYTCSIKHGPFRSLLLLLTKVQSDVEYYVVSASSLLH